MGYYTYYDLQVLNEDKFSAEEISKASHRLAEIMGENKPFSDEYNDFSWISYDSMKWYDNKEHMLQLAKEFPNMLFKLYGDGEDSDDMWIDYYQGNRYHSQGWHWDPTPKWTQYKREVST